jgi:hypothetical protein
LTFPRPGHLQLLIVAGVVLRGKARRRVWRKRSNSGNWAREQRQQDLRRVLHGAASEAESTANPADNNDTADKGQTRSPAWRQIEGALATPYLGASRLKHSS